MSPSIINLFFLMVPVGEKEDLIRFLEQTKDSTQHIACDISTQSDKGETLLFRFMMRFSFIRVEESLGANKVLHVITDKNHSKLLFHQEKPLNGFISPIPPTHKIAVRLDLRELLGILLLYKDGHQEATHIIKEDPSAKIKIMKHDGKTFHVLKYEYSAGTHNTVIKVECWYDPAMNGTVYKRILEMISDEPYVCSYCEYTVSEYTEHVPGLFLPKKIDTKSHFYMKKTKQEKLHQTNAIHILNYKMHPDLPDSLFQLTFPPGAQVFDEVNKKIWKVLDDGSLAPLKKDGQEVTMNQAELPYATNDPRSLLGPTRAEPGSGGLWFILGGLALLLLAVGYWLWQKRRERLEMS